MILPRCFERDWIERFKEQEEYSKLNPPILEKMIQALYLLQNLKKNGFDFVFKGGTSLILILEQAKRFSVDIDVITTHSKEEVETILDSIVANSHFTAWHLDEVRSYKPGVPKAHYELEYASNINRNSNYILLDVLFEQHHYPAIVEKPVVAQWIETQETILISVPTVEAIAGDKLTAFAPNTTGILYGKNKELEIIKQLFDIGHLFDQITDVAMMHQSFGAFVIQEIAYRSLTIEPVEVLWDIINTARIISMRERNKEEPQKSHFKALLIGIKAFSNFLISGNFRIEDAIIASAKTAYLAAKILVNDLNTLVRYNGEDISGLNIENQQWNGLNTLKKMPDKSAFFYWYKTLELLELQH